MHALATLGYQYWDTPSLVATLTEMEAICVDVRMYPTSKRPEWSREALQSALGHRYRHLPDLGNPNAGGRGGGLALYRPERGIPKLLQMMERQRVVILCQCPDWRQCHRSLIVQAVAEQTTVEIIHLEPPPPLLEPGEMIACTLHQPWASLVAVEYYAPGYGKRDETRSWPTGHRGWIAIHAAKGGLSKSELAGYFERRVFREALARINIAHPDQLPRGQVVAVGYLRSCDPTEVRYPMPAREEPNWWFGDFREGRWAWRLDPIIALPEPEKASGLQKLWKWQPSPAVWELIAQAERGGAAPPPPPRPSVPAPLPRTTRAAATAPTQTRLPEPETDDGPQQLSFW